MDPKPNADASDIEKTGAATAQAAPTAPSVAPAPIRSLADLEREVANEDAVEFEPLINGEPSGIVLLILSEQAPSVDKAINEAINARRRAEQLRAAEARSARPGHEPITKIEDDITYSHRLCAFRIHGWVKGLSDPVTQENKMRLLSVAPKFIPQILQKSADLADFTAASSKK